MVIALKAQGPTETPSNEPTHRLGRRALSTHLLARLLARLTLQVVPNVYKLIQKSVFLTYTGVFLKIRNADFQGICLDYQRILNVER